MKPDVSRDPKSDSILDAMAAHKQALDTLRYGSFRGVVRDGKLVRFAIEQEWRPTEHREKEVV
jgi:hypothetical protein